MQHATLLREVSHLVSALSPVNHKRIIPGLCETFIQKCTVQRISQAEIRPEEQSEKAESCRENL